MQYYKSFDDYRDAWNSAFIKDPPIPLNIDLELSAICNLKCPFCFIANQKYNHKKVKPYMDFDLAVEIINQASSLGVPALKFNWRGEPTLNPYFSEIIKYARKTKHFYELLVNTNGNIPNAAIDGLFFCTKVMFSVDSFNEDTYKKCRIKGNLKEVIHTIKLLIDRGHENIWVRRVINKDNEKENFVKDARKLFKNKVFVAEHYVYERSNDYKLEADRVYCGYPSQRLTVTTDGQVFPCCVDYNQTMYLGNVKDTTLQEIWLDTKLNFIRNTLKINNIPELYQCYNCTSYLAYNSIKRDKVKDVNIK